MTAAGSQWGTGAGPGGDLPPRMSHHHHPPPEPRRPVEPEPGGLTGAVAVVTPRAAVVLEHPKVGG